MNENYRIRSMSDQDLNMVLAWRNHSSVRKNMYTTNKISKKDHQKWFLNTSAQTDKHLLIFENQDIPVGFVQLHEINAGGIADWGFYTAPDAPRGTGTALGKAALAYAFQNLSLHKIAGQVLGFNKKSIGFHFKLGFMHEGTLVDHHFDGEKYHDVWHFGMCVSNWD